MPWCYPRAFSIIQLKIKLDNSFEQGQNFAVVGLHSNSFKPHTPTKTSVIFLQKWNNEPEESRNDYPIFFATQKVTFKDNSGNYINALNDHGKLEKDSTGNTIFQSDLNEIADKFLEWGKSEGLNFINE